MVLRLAGFLIFTAAATWIHIRSLLSKKQRKEAGVAIGIFILSAVLGTLKIMEVALPSLLVPVRFLFEPFGKMVLGD
jgi:hypothetical protein